MSNKEPDRYEIKHNPSKGKSFASVEEAAKAVSEVKPLYVGGIEMAISEKMMSKEPDRYEIKHNPSKFKGFTNVQEAIEKTVSDLEKSNPEFMKGYTRDVHGTGKLLSALAKSMEKHPNLRLGQLLYNALETYYARLADENGVKHNGMKFRTHFHNYLFNIYDEELIEAIEKYE